MEVTVGIEAHAQAFGVELDEVVIIGNDPCPFCGSISCAGECQTCPCCTTPYCLGLHCYSDCPDGNTPCIYCSQCGCNGECRNACSDGSEPCYYCGQCGCNGECIDPPKPDTPICEGIECPVYHGYKSSGGAQ